MDALEGLIEKNNSKILLLVLDGIGGLPVEGGKTELELAKTPNLDSLAVRSALGMHIPVDYGITPGSGPGHLGIFGYDPLEYRIGRGILEALGLGLEVRDTDIAIRGNYATVEYVNGKPVVKDRRAGRIPTEENRRITGKIQESLREIDGVQVIVAPGMEHRTAIVLRFPEPLPQGSDDINDTDPQEVGKEPLEPVGKNPNAQRVAEIVKNFSQKPNIPTMEERFGVKACCIAVYPMYKGLASLVGMDLIEFEGDTIRDEIETLGRVWKEYDFFFVHIKKTDSYGEDGNWKGKVSVIEEFDGLLPEFLKYKPDVVAITGDHSTPSLLKGHSWHPVPMLIHSPYVLGGTSERFTERGCLKGELGILPAKKLINLLLANAHRLKKYGA